MNVPVVLLVVAALLGSPVSGAAFFWQYPADLNMSNVATTTASPSASTPTTLSTEAPTTTGPRQPTPEEEADCTSQIGVVENGVHISTMRKYDMEKILEEHGGAPGKLNVTWNMDVPEFPVEDPTVKPLPDTVNTTFWCNMGTKRERNAPKGYLNSPGLISVVSKYPVLWDFINHPNYTNSAARDAAWEKVAERFLDATPQECQTKWQSIKRALANSRRRQRIYEYSGAPADSKRKCRPYKYCKNLSFLDSLKLEEEDVQDGTMSGSENDTGLSGSDMEGSSLLSTETEHTLSIHEVSTALDEAGSSEELTTVIPNKAFLPFKNLQQNSQDYTPQQNGLFMAFKLEQALNKQQKQGRPKNGKVNPHIKEDLKTPIKKNKTIQNSREVEDYLDTTQEMSENDKENSPLKSPIVVVKQKKNKKKISPKIVLVEQPSIVSGGESDSEEEVQYEIELWNTPEY
ncbi:hypothetical protein FOCC_FOCC006648 [Frankliniella occidentalis]|nr:hypothetical protein FOCC_FOCC006648 [Frankliniella occidentalis]